MGPLGCSPPRVARVKHASARGGDVTPPPLQNSSTRWCVPPQAIRVRTFTTRNDNQPVFLFFFKSSFTGGWRNQRPFVSSHINSWKVAPRRRGHQLPQVASLAWLRKECDGVYATGFSPYCCGFSPLREPPVGRSHSERAGVNRSLKLRAKGCFHMSATVH